MDTGIYKCERCGGYGFPTTEVSCTEVVLHGKKFKIPGPATFSGPCEICGGSGKVDWVQNILKRAIRL